MIKRNTGTKVGVAAVLALALAACGDAVAPEVTNVEFAASLGIDLALMTETASGLFIREDSIGVGEPAAAGDQVTVAYTGWLADGEIFDSSASFVITALPVLGGARVDRRLHRVRHGYEGRRHQNLRPSGRSWVRVGGAR